MQVRRAMTRLEMARSFGNDSEEDWQFHQIIITAAANPFFSKIIRSMHALMHQFWENPLSATGAVKMTLVLPRRNASE